MAAFTAFHDLIVPEVLQCPQPLVDIHLRETARHFCLSTSAWEVALDAINLVSGQAAYDLASSESASDVLRLTQVVANGTLLWTDTDFKTEASTDATPKYQREDPPFFLTPDLLTITLADNEVPTADVVGGLVLTGVLRPSRTATTLPDFLLSQYSDAMRVGTLAKLLVMGDRPWTDRSMAAVYLSDYQRILSFAAYQGAIGNTRKHLRVKKWG